MKVESNPLCAEIEVWLSPLVDGELSGEDQALIEDHVTHCSQCAAQRLLLAKTKAALASSQTAVEAPPSLVAKIRADHRQERQRGRTTKIAAASLAVVLVGAGAFLGGTLVDDGAPVSSDPLVLEALDQHTLNVPVDLASTDPVNVEHYLATRVTPPPQVPRLDAQGLSLKGARVVSVERQRAAQLVYQGPTGENLSLTVVPDANGVLRARLRAGPDPQAIAHEGTVGVSLVHKMGSLYTAVGDLRPDAMHAALDAIPASVR